MPTINENKFWNTDYNWTKDGDEWSDQAEYCGKNYSDWKNSIVDNYILPNIGHEITVLEIAPGHGRWTEYLAGKCRELILVDLNPVCIDYCKNKFKDLNNIKYFVNDGKNLSFIQNKSVNFIWSYDSFVHMEADVIDSYFKEFSRILKKGGQAIIHHPGRQDREVFFKFLKKLGPIGNKLYSLISNKKTIADKGWRSIISKNLIRRLAKKNNLSVILQQDSWGFNKEYNVKLFNDCITKLQAI